MNMVSSSVPFSPSFSLPSCVAIACNDAYDIVYPDQVIRCEGWEKYTRIYMLDRPVLLSSYNIGVFRKMLEPYGFFACHKSHLINDKRVVRYHKEGTVTMSDGSQVPVSRRRKEDFARLFLRGWGER